MAYLCGKKKSMEYPNNGNVLSSLRPMELSSTIPDIGIDTPVRLWVVVSVDGSTVFEEWLYPVDGRIVLEDLRGLVEPYAYVRQTVVLEITAMTDGSNEVLDTTATVVYCECDFGDETAADYLENHFLSKLQGPKLTAVGRLEILPVQGSASGSVTATYRNDTTGAVETGSGSARTYLSREHFTELDVSPGLFAVAGKTLLEYVVSVGRRRQKYIVDQSAPDCAPILIFYNSFGVEEVVYCTGTHRVDPSYKRSAIYIGRRLRNYRIEETRSFKADTGPLTPAMADWLEDLFRSKCVRVANMYNGVLTPGKEVVVTESKSSHSNADDEIPRFTFTYQYGQSNHNVGQLEREGRIFDNTFDNTFN